MFLKENPCLPNPCNNGNCTAIGSLGKYVCKCPFNCNISFNCSDCIDQTDKSGELEKKNNYFTNNLVLFVAFFQIIFFIVILFLLLCLQRFLNWYCFKSKNFDSL